MRRKWIVAAIVAALVGVGVAVTAVGRSDYTLHILMPSSDGAFEGGSVVLRGERVGEVIDIGVKDGKALVAVRVDEEHAPLPAGTSARVSWQSLVGSRVVELLPGPGKNPALPSGKMITSENERVEVDDLVAALDKPTLVRVKGVVKQLQRTLSGREDDLAASVKTGGPTVEALGAVLRAVGEDGPAIRELVTNLNDMASELTARDRELGETVSGLGRLTSVTAQKQRQLSATLDELPATVDEATKTLDDVPAAVDATVPVLRDLQPAAERLPSVAEKLSPVLKTLRPTVASLRPTLASAQTLLKHTPGLLDTAHGTLPGATRALKQLQPAVTFLRPYTPEAAGWLSNWTSAWGSENGAGNYVRALITASASSVDDNPGLVPPGLQQSEKPEPGEPVGQPWTDANGDGIR